ncbi:MAG: coproporphyrinogen-III oxidase family protein [Planctomycetota bacterium]
MSLRKAFVTELETIETPSETQVGSYFVANYPPFSAWTPEHVPVVDRVLDTPSGISSTQLGLYLHIPFCRTRCKFCYFRVYTDKNSRDVEQYLDALCRELSILASKPAFADRSLDFVYFGGGTPSYLSDQQLERLAEGIARSWTWKNAREVTFECEPGTLKKHKLETIKAIGTTRLSLGVEHFDDGILELNGRAHRSAEIFRAYEWAREVGFRQINIDLIAGMLGDTQAQWSDAVERALALNADSVTIYQMEVPHNTLIARESRQGSGTSVIDWPTKRAWVDEAFRRFENAGYVVSSAYTLVKPGTDDGFVYRDALWHGADLIGAGVASFSHVQGVHFQNADRWEDYVDRLVNNGELPITRALPMTPRQVIIRQFILQLKLGRLESAYFKARFGVDVLAEFSEPLNQLRRRGLMDQQDDRIQLTREGLLRVDSVLPIFFEPQFQNVRYT